jgi:hypothetical protein
MFMIRLVYVAFLVAPVSGALSPLHLLLEPFYELRQGSAAVGNLVLLCLGHFGVRLAFVFEACVPSLEVSVLDLASKMGG